MEQILMLRIAIGGLLLLLLGIGYNWAIGRLEREGLLEGHVAYSVVAGVAGTLVVAGIATDAWPIVGVVFLMFACSGAPMVLGSYWRNAQARREFENGQAEQALERARQVWKAAHPEEKA